MSSVTFFAAIVCIQRKGICIKTPLAISAREPRQITPGSNVFSSIFFSPSLFFGRMFSVLIIYWSPLCCGSALLKLGQRPKAVVIFMFRFPFFFCRHHYFSFTEELNFSAGAGEIQTAESAGVGDEKGEEGGKRRACE